MGPHLGSLSDELLLMVLEEVRRASPWSLLSMCLTAHRFCRLATSLIYQQVSIPSRQLQDNDDKTLLEERFYNFEANVVAYARHITVCCLLNWFLFSNLLSRMQHLETVTWHFWDSPFPSIVKKVLRKQCPNVKLYIENLSIGYRTDDEDVQTADLNLLKSLVGIQNIHAVKVVINYEHPVSMRWLKDALISSKNLEVLHLSPPRNHDGRIEWRNDDLGQYDLCVEEGERLESLTELVYESRSFYATKLIPVSFFNWSKIRHLELRGHILRHYVHFLQTQEVYFHTLVLESIASSAYLQAGNKFLDEFLNHLHGLKRLALVTPLDQIPIDTIALHGDTLRSLSIRFIRRSVDPYSILVNIPPYEVQQIDSLNTSCPHISSLALDIGIADFMPYDILTAISRFPHLTTIRLYFRFAATGTYFGHNYCPTTAGNKNIPHVYTDRLTVRHIFSYISTHKVGCRLEQLEVMMGDFPRSLARVGMGPRDPERPNILFICHEDSNGSIVVRDDVTDHEDVGWNRYFDMQRLATQPGQTWPENLEEIMAAEEEADRIMKGIDMLDDDTESLFGEP
ncbi:hypothetical protein EG329_001381 [Mollisiaceae sp. DMI_Dod_QoI]|nr:hypothetical protein EG329_001381 [Helotiales sp. DMI_Dod_QoI]